MKNTSLIILKEYPVSIVLDKLLQDKTTKRNIIFATDAYKTEKSDVDKTTEITSAMLFSLDAISIQPRVHKTLEKQTERTKKKAEVFTPVWICNRMNNHCDEEWFGRKNVFNTEQGKNWTITDGKIEFPKKKTWKQYVDSKRLEITCGEAPYIVSRYDAVSGNPIHLQKRIGILDRKLRIVNENAETEEVWLKWVYRAFQSVYGYEFQGDNLLIARINLLMTFVEYMQDRWRRIPTKKELEKIANIITWNIWQMDGITGMVPFCSNKTKQCNLFEFALYNTMGEVNENVPCECRIFDWRSKRSLVFNSIKNK